MEEAANRPTVAGKNLFQWTDNADSYSRNDHSARDLSSRDRGDVRLSRGGVGHNSNKNNTNKTSSDARTSSKGEAGDSAPGPERRGQRPVSTRPPYEEKSPPYEEKKLTASDAVSTSATSGAGAEVSSLVAKAKRDDFKKDARGDNMLPRSRGKVDSPSGPSDARPVSAWQLKKQQDQEKRDAQRKLTTGPVPPASEDQEIKPTVPDDGGTAVTSTPSLPDKRFAGRKGDAKAPYVKAPYVKTPYVKTEHPFVKTDTPVIVRLPGGKTVRTAATSGTDQMVDVPPPTSSTADVSNPAAAALTPASTPVPTPVPVSAQRTPYNKPRGPKVVPTQAPASSEEEGAESAVPNRRRRGLREPKEPKEPKETSTAKEPVPTLPTPPNPRTDRTTRAPHKTSITARAAGDSHRIAPVVVDMVVPPVVVAAVVVAVPDKKEKKTASATAAKFSAKGSKAEVGGKFSALSLDEDLNNELLRSSGSPTKFAAVAGPTVTLLQEGVVFVEETGAANFDLEDGEFTTVVSKATLAKEKKVSVHVMCVCVFIYV